MSEHKANNGLTGFWSGLGIFKFKLIKNLVETDILLAKIKITNFVNEVCFIGVSSKI